MDLLGKLRAGVALGTIAAAVATVGHDPGRGKNQERPRGTALRRRRYDARDEVERRLRQARCALR
jgi:hypothetical protein